MFLLHTNYDVQIPNGRLTLKLKLAAAAMVFLSAYSVVQAQDLNKDTLANETKVWDTFVGTRPNLEAFRRLVAPGYLCIEATGVLMTTEENIAQLQGMTFSSYKIQDPQVRKLSSKSALIVARVKFEGTVDNHPMSGETLTSTVWVKEGGKWLVQLHTETFQKADIH